MSILAKEKIKKVITKDNFKKETFCVWEYKKSIPFTTMVNNDDTFNFKNISKVLKDEVKGSFEKIYEHPNSIIYINKNNNTLVRLSQHWSNSLNSSDKKGKDIKLVNLNMPEGLVYWIIDYKESDMGINQWKITTTKIEKFKVLGIIQGNIINDLGHMVPKTFYEVDGKELHKTIDDYLDSN